MLRMFWGTLHALAVVLKALLWLRIVFVTVGVQENTWLVRSVMKITGILIEPFDRMIDFNLYILGFRVDLVALLIIVILDIISHTILEIKKGYE